MKVHVHSHDETKELLQQYQIQLLAALHLRCYEQIKMFQSNVNHNPHHLLHEQDMLL